MVNTTFKQIALTALLGGALCVTAATAQSDACSLKLNAYSFVEGTTQTNPINCAEIKLTDVKTGKTHQYTTSTRGEVSVDGIAQSTYEVSVTKAGFRKSVDSVNYDCSRLKPTTLQGTPVKVSGIII